MEFYVTAAPGTEGALRDELSELGFRQVRLNHGGIPFFGDWSEGWRACMATHIGQRVMAVMGRFSAPDLENVYDAVSEVRWEDYLTPAQTFAVYAYTHASTGWSPNQVALKAKDAIADQLRHSFGERPNVDKEDPDVRVFVYWARGKATVYLDLSGEPLFKRGYRLLGGEAPLKETLAAAVVRLSGWDRSTPLVDPMCGSGTLPIEAALWAADIAPNLRRERFGFQRWASFDAEAARRLKKVQGELRRGRNSQMPRITGFDIDERALDAAHANAQNAGLRLSFRRMPLRELQPDNTRRLLVCNPPYGIRLDADNQLYQDLANAVHRLKGWRIAILAGSPRCVAGIRIQPVETHPLKNGDIDCRLLVYEP